MERSPIAIAFPKTMLDAWGVAGAPHAFMFALRPPYSVWPLRNGRIGDRRDAADSRCAGWKRRRRDKKRISLGRRRTTSHAHTRVSIDVGIRLCETVRE